MSDKYEAALKAHFAECVAKGAAEKAKRERERGPKIVDLPATLIGRTIKAASSWVDRHGDTDSISIELDNGMIIQIHASDSDGGAILGWEIECRPRG